MAVKYEEKCFMEQAPGQREKRNKFIWAAAQLAVLNGSTLICCQFSNFICVHENVLARFFSNFRIADFSFYDRVNAGTRLYFLLSETFLSSLNHKSFGRETTV